MSEPITGITTPIRMEYRYTPGTATSQFLRAMKEGRFEGRRCPSCSKVYFPPRGGCSMCGVRGFANGIRAFVKGVDAYVSIG